jgi:hypothetical protein
MAGFFPSRRLLGLPAWLWVLLPVPLLALGYLLPKVWPPTDIAEPPLRAEVFREPILVAREGDSFRFVPYGEHMGVSPLWEINVVRRSSESLHWTRRYYIPGLFRMEGRWTYGMAAYRFDGDRKGDAENPVTLPEDQARQLSPLVVAELNRRHPSARLGGRLEAILTDGVEATSYAYPQNALILLAWFSIPMAVVGLCLMFFRPGMTPVHEGGKPA